MKYLSNVTRKSPTTIFKLSRFHGQKVTSLYKNYKTEKEKGRWSENSNPTRQNVLVFRILKEIVRIMSEFKRMDGRIRKAISRSDSKIRVRLVRIWIIG